MTQLVRQNKPGTSWETFSGSGRSLVPAKLIADPKRWLGDLKGRRSALNDLVDQFRTTYQMNRGIKGPGHEVFTPKDLGCIRYYCALFNRGLVFTAIEKKAIERISTGAKYNNIRQAGRLRAYTRPLDEDTPSELRELRRLCLEIKAASVWQVIMSRHPELLFENRKKRAVS